MVPVDGGLKVTLDYRYIEVVQDNHIILRNSNQSYIVEKDFFVCLFVCLGGGRGGRRKQEFNGACAIIMTDVFMFKSLPS